MIKYRADQNNFINNLNSFKSRAGIDSAIDEMANLTDKNFLN